MSSFITLTNYYGGGRVVIPVSRLCKSTIVETMRGGTKITDPANAFSLSVVENADTILQRIKEYDDKRELQLGLELDTE